MTTDSGRQAAEARPSAGARILMFLIGGYRRFISPMTVNEFKAGASWHGQRLLPVGTAWERSGVKGASVPS